MRNLFLIIFTLFISVLTMAQVASPVPSPAALPAVDALSNWLSSHIAMAVVGLGFLIELIVRAIPTAKPQSILLWVSSALNSVVKLLQTLSAYADKLLQNSKG